MPELVNYWSGQIWVLLLSALLLSKGAAECPDPPKKEHLVLTKESLLKNDYPDGTVITYTCTNGHEKHNGSDSITCTGTQWTEPELLCKKKDCGLPRASLNMEFLIENGTLFGARMKVYCLEGYMIVGSVYKHCYAGGWLGRAKCQRIRCSMPDDVIDGQHSWVSSERPAYSDIVQYTCDPGFNLVGHHQRKCKGEYDSTAPTCEGPKDNSTTPMPTTVSITSTTPTSVQGGKYELVATDKDNVMSTKASTISSSSSVATGGTHGANTGMTTHEHAPSTQSEPAAGVTTSQPFPGGNMREHDTKKDTGYIVVIISVISTVIVVLIVLIIVYRFLRRRRGSYDTREDLKPELLQFQSLEVKGRRKWC